MKNLLLALGLVALASLTVATTKAQDLNVPNWTATADTYTLPEYLGPDDATFHAGWVQQSETFISHRSGTRFGLWHSEPYTGRETEPNMGREIDLIVGHSRKVGEYKIDGSATLFGISPLHEMKGDVMYLSGKISREYKLSDRSALEPLFVWDEYFPVDLDKPHGGRLLHGGMIYSRLLHKRLGVSWGNELAHDSGAFDFHAGFIGKSKAEFALALTNKVSLLLPLRLDSPISHLADGRKTKFVVGFGFAYKF